MELSLQSGLVDAEAAWRLVADTDHLHRVGGLPPVETALEPDEHGFPVVTGTFLGPAGIRHRFEERTQRWVLGRSFARSRHIEGPLLAGMTYEAVLEPRVRGEDPGEPEGPGVVARVRFELQPVGKPQAAALALSFRALKAQWQRELDALPAPGAQAGPRTIRQLDPRAEELLDRWRARCGSDAFARVVRQRLCCAPDWALHTVQPLVLGNEAGVDEQVALEAALEAVNLGLFELRWRTRCPHCGATVRAGSSLADMPVEVACRWCEHGFQVHLDEDVEVVLSVSSTLAPGIAERFCTFFPMLRPDLVALVQLSGGEEDTVEVELDRGFWNLGRGGTAGDTVLEVVPDGPTELSWSTKQAPPTLEVGPGRCLLHLRNPGESKARVVLRRATEERRLSAARLATWPGYHRRLGPPFVAPGPPTRVRRVTLLFTDLVGSTQLYRRLGDTEAFDLIRTHFDALQETARAHHGVLVKTVGDSVQLAFHDPADATQAALAMLPRFQRWAAGHGLGELSGLRLGIDEGPVLAAHTDTSGLDYFGATPSIAARCCALAAAGELVITDAVAQVPAVKAVLGELPRTEARLALSGVADVPVWRLRPAAV